MKDNLQDFQESLGYEEGVGPSNVDPSMQKKKIIGTQCIIGVVDIYNRRELFGEERNLTWICSISGII